MYLRIVLYVKVNRCSQKSYTVLLFTEIEQLLKKQGGKNMPIYENRSNAENLLRLPQEKLLDIVCGCDAGAEKIAGTVKNKSVILCESWYGTPVREFAGLLSEKLISAGKKVKLIPASDCFKSLEEISAMKQVWITEEPAFGRVNEGETLEDYISQTAVSEVEKTVFAAVEAGEVVIVYGTGSSFVNISGADVQLIYFDQTADPVLWQMWNGELVSFGTNEPRRDYGWKEYYYCDFYVMFRHKRKIWNSCSWYAGMDDKGAPVLMPAALFREALEQLTTQPLKQIRTYSPGPWGAYRYRDLWDIPGLKNNAWNRLAGADLSVLAEFSKDILVNFPSMNLLIDNSVNFVGKYPAEAFPELIPVEIWLDDGYFPEPQPAERTSMPIHNHPGTEYVKRHFNEPLGRYETYYIVEAYEGANTNMGFKEDASLEEWERLCRESWEQQKPIPNWKDFIANWDTNVGDLFLIPEGTTHGHGGNQMVLEMDTCGNAAGGEYSFFGYDFMRPTWDDKAGTMTGKPMKMHLDRYFSIDKCCRASYVKENLKPRAKVVKWTKEYSMDRFDTLPQMPFEIERLHFTERAVYTTEGKFLHAVTLTQGKSAIIRSLAHPERYTRLERLQCALVPACFGEYEIIAEQPGSSTAVLWRLKKG